MGNGMLPRNPIGRTISRLRSEKDWSQDYLAIQLQCVGVDVSRDMLARIELGITRVNLEFIIGLQRVFRLPVIRFFPKHIQDLDAQFAQKPAVQSSNRVTARNTRRKCRKLTKGSPPP